MRRERPFLGAFLLAAYLLAGACGNQRDNGAVASHEPASWERPSITIAPDGPPRHGGELTIGLAAETDGWDPTRNRWGSEGTVVGLGLFDPLAAFDESGDWTPYLAESLEPNADFTEWTITVRPGISFHNGEPLDASAVKQTLDAHRQSALTAAAWSQMDRIESAGPRTVIVHLSSPWASFPVQLTGQAGVVVAPAQLADRELGSRPPVGTGPFRFVEWIPDKHLVVERNPAYWRHDDRGESLPYVDRIEFRVLADEDSRLLALRAGDVDLTYSTFIGAALRYRELADHGEIQVVEQQGQTGTAFVMLNTERPPFDDLRARRAVAHATDRQAWVELNGDGALEPATTVFRPSSRWHAEVGFPELDLERARAEVAAYEADRGPLAFRLAGVATPAVRLQTELLQRMWEAAGIQVDITISDVGAGIQAAVTGDYEATMFVLHGSPDPDYEHVWWHSSSARPPGEVSLNFARHRDAQLDDALDRARATDDLEVRQEAYRVVQERFAENVPYIWLSHTQQVLGARNHVRGLTAGPLPDGRARWPLSAAGGFSMAFSVTQLWIER
jgi:peptide/nickel transport system substrate-binding protein